MRDAGREERLEIHVRLDVRRLLLHRTKCVGRRKRMSVNEPRSVGDRIRRCLEWLQGHEM